MLWTRGELVTGILTGSVGPTGLPLERKCIAYIRTGMWVENKNDLSGVERNENVIAPEISRLIIVLVHVVYFVATFWFLLASLLAYWWTSIVTDRIPVIMSHSRCFDKNIFFAKRHGLSYKINSFIAFVNCWINKCEGRQWDTNGNKPRHSEFNSILFQTHNIQWNSWN